MILIYDIIILIYDICLCPKRKTINQAQVAKWQFSASSGILIVRLFVSVLLLNRWLIFKCCSFIFWDSSEIKISSVIRVFRLHNISLNLPVLLYALINLYFLFCIAFDLLAWRTRTPQVKLKRRTRSGHGNTEIGICLTCFEDESVSNFSISRFNKSSVKRYDDATTHGRNSLIAGSNDPRAVQVVKTLNKNEKSR